MIYLAFMRSSEICGVLPSCSPPERKISVLQRGKTVLMLRIIRLQTFRGKPSGLSDARYRFLRVVGSWSRSSAASFVFRSLVRYAWVVSMLTPNGPSRSRC
jgi:hypothetical protein